MICDWWKSHGEHSPVIGMIPKTSYIFSLDGIPYLSCSLILTNTAAAWIENVVGNPSVDRGVRAKLLPLVFKYLERIGEKLGKTYFLIFLENQKLRKKYEQCGYIPFMDEATALVKGVD